MFKLVKARNGLFALNSTLMLILMFVFQLLILDCGALTLLVVMRVVKRIVYEIVS